MGLFGKRKPKTPVDSDENFDTNGDFEKLKPGTESGPRSKKSFVMLAVLAAWLIALTIVLVIFIGQTPTTDLESRVEKLESKSKVGGKIVMPDQNRLDDIDRRLAKVETQGTGMLPDQAQMNQISLMDERLKQVEDKVANIGQPLSGDAASILNVKAVGSDLEKRVERLEELLSKTSKSAALEIASNKESAKEEAKIAPVKKEDPALVAQAAVPEKKMTSSKKKTTPRVSAAKKKSVASRSLKPEKSVKAESLSRGFISGQVATAGGSSVTTSYSQLGGYYDSRYENSRQELSQFGNPSPRASSPTDTLINVGGHYQYQYELNSAQMSGN